MFLKKFINRKITKFLGKFEFQIKQVLFQSSAYLKGILCAKVYPKDVLRLFLIHCLYEKIIFNIGPCGRVTLSSVRGQARGGLNTRLIGLRFRDWGGNMVSAAFPEGKME